MKNKKRFQPRAIYLLVASASLPTLSAMMVTSASAQAAANSSQITPTSKLVAAFELAPITVTATKIEQSTSDVAATVSVIDEKDREKTLANDIRDLIKYEPGISVRAAASRFTAAGSGTGRDGNAGFNIRGIDGNNILMQTDGVRLPLAFSFGASNFGRGDYLDVDAYKSVEILRGPASTLYGSDGLAGAVSFITKDPSDFLSSQSNSYFGLKGSYASADDSNATTLTWAARVGDFGGTPNRFEFMLLLTKRNGTETANKGSNDAENITRTIANPQQIASDYVLGKAVYRLDTKNTLKLTAEQFERGVRTNVLTARARAPLAASSVIDLQADDELTRNRVSLDYRYAGSAKEWLMSASVTAYGQRAQTLSLNAEDRNTAADRRRDNTYRENARGLVASLVSEFSVAGVMNRIVYGGDVSVSKVVSIRDGLVPPVGEKFPTKPFPDTDYTLSGFFVQDEIFIGERASLIPGLRFDRYKLVPEQGDPLFTADAAPPNLSGSKTTPKLGAVIHFTPNFSSFIQLAEGFRAPTPSQVNNGFANLISNYRSVSNPTLRAETSRSIELGLRGANTQSSWEIVAFNSRYKDFISQVQTGGDFTPANPAIFKYLNLGTVKIYGAEAKGKVIFGNHFSVFGNLAYAKGDDTSANQPLETIDPLKAVLALEYRHENFGAQIVGQFTRTKESSRVPAPESRSGAGAAYLSPASNVFDVQGFYAFSKAVQLNWAINNITDKKYWVWADVRGQSASSAVLDSFTQPGRNYAVSLKVIF